MRALIHGGPKDGAWVTIPDDARTVYFPEEVPVATWALDTGEVPEARLLTRAVPVVIKRNKYAPYAVLYWDKGVVT